MPLSIIVERRDSRGGHFAVSIPYEVRDSQTIVIDHTSALGAFELLRSAAAEKVANTAQM